MKLFNLFKKIEAICQGKFILNDDVCINIGDIVYPRKITSSDGYCFGSPAEIVNIEISNKGVKYMLRTENNNYTFAYQKDCFKTKEELINSIS
jgi:hypothetical protein